MSTTNRDLPNLPEQRAAEDAERVCEDHRPRLLRWLLPTSCASSVPLTGMQEARIKLVAYH